MLGEKFRFISSVKIAKNDNFHDFGGIFMKKELVKLLGENDEKLLEAMEYSDEDFWDNIKWIQSLLKEFKNNRFEVMLEDDLIESLNFAFGTAIAFLTYRFNLHELAKVKCNIEDELKIMKKENDMLRSENEQLLGCGVSVRNKQGLSPEEAAYLFKINDDQEEKIKNLEKELAAANKKVSALTEERDDLITQVDNLSETYNQSSTEAAALNEAEKTRLSNLKPREPIDNALNLKELRIAALRGDTLEKIAEKNGVSTATFKKWLKEAGYKNWREFKKKNGYDKATLNELLDFDF